MRVTWKQLEDEPVAVAVRLAQALAAQQHAGPERNQQHSSPERNRQHAGPERNRLHH
jgi:Cu/Zn superoxide dismutase